ncbi:SAM-dependent methyltransferase [Nocardia sp. CDC159]|uniref:SAM-dependent methyltransferase n=1 Tax=Nocardia pulmonis TaxID=2951408 RepID=A0A9X2EG05_9NOCA|nr:MULTISPECIES: SAM-dependent methyltransferase [Nocardia]MCM6778830.1 SAM-dependent methyltransferase [Nocardia pulmonis]MCM6791719.1 SAM-dependent methyltransferase [Nocardia sp. CDC159]
MSNIERAPRGVDPSKPNSARVYDYLLGGRSHYTTDRVLAEQMVRIAPDIQATAAAHRQFLLQAVLLAAEAGVRQFLDIGAGIPTSPAVHEMAHKVDEGARVVSVDHDPVVHAHATAFLSGVPGVIPLLADVRRADELVERLRAERLIDFAEPVAILLGGVIHYVMDTEHPDRIHARFREVMAPGSYLILTHATDDTVRDFRDLATQSVGGSAQFAYRTRAEVEKFFEGFDLLGPGVTPVQQWLDARAAVPPVVIVGGVGRRP